MKARLLTVLAGLSGALSGPAALAQGQRAELLAAPAWLEEPMAPRFVVLEPNELGDALKIIASRHWAAVDFNAPEIQLHLPLVDNSTYAQVDMPEPRLIGIDGRSVEARVARPPHVVKTQIVEIRLLPVVGEGPVDFARAVGEVTVRYPLEVETRTIVAGRPDPIARIDGPYVEIVDGVLAEAPSLSPLEPVRGYDAEGHQLQTAPFPTMRISDGRTLRRIAFRGGVARVELDRVVRAAEVTLRYDVPVAEPLPQLRYGVRDEAERDAVPHPSTRLTVSIRASSAAIPLPTPTPRPRAEPPAEATGRGEPASAPPPGRESLSSAARGFADALDALEGAIGRPAGVVQLVAYPPTMVTLSVGAEGGGAESWTWRDGEVFGPRELDVSGLECRAPLEPGALALVRLPALVDDAGLRAGSEQEAARVLVSQRPCGTPEIRVTLRDGAGVVYSGDGRFVAVETE